MWEVMQFTSLSAYVIGISTGVEIELHIVDGIPYRTPYKIEAQQIADELNGVEYVGN